MEEFKPKHTLSDSKEFQEGREKMGGLILEQMETTGGTDLDWIIERKGGFIILEWKRLIKDRISIPLGQMITFENLYYKLNLDSKCHFLIFGSDDIDFKNPDSKIWYFDMADWVHNKIKYKHDMGYGYRRWLVYKQDMTETSVGEFRTVIDKYWNEFSNP